MSQLDQPDRPPVPAGQPAGRLQPAATAAGGNEPSVRSQADWQSLVYQTYLARGAQRPLSGPIWPVIVLGAGLWVVLCLMHWLTRG